MRKSCCFAAVAVFGIMLGSGSVWAHGPYIGGSAGSVSVESEFDDISFDFDESDTAWSGYAGVEFAPGFAIEVSYNDFGAFSARNVFGGIITDVDSEFTGYDVFAKLALPVGPVDLFGKAGIVFWDAEVTAVVDDPFGGPLAFRDSDNGNDFAVGLGLEYPLTDVFSLRGEVEWFDIEDTEVVTFGSVGLTWRF